MDQNMAFFPDKSKPKHVWCNILSSYFWVKKDTFTWAIDEDQHLRVTVKYGANSVCSITSSKTEIYVQNDDALVIYDTAAKRKQYILWSSIFSIEILEEE